MVSLQSLAIFRVAAELGDAFRLIGKVLGFPMLPAVEFQLCENDPPAIDFRIRLSTGPKVCVGSPRLIYLRDDSRQVLSHLCQPRAAPGGASRPIADWSVG